MTLIRALIVGVVLGWTTPYMTGYQAPKQLSSTFQWLDVVYMNLYCSWLGLVLAFMAWHLAQERVNPKPEVFKNEAIQISYIAFVVMSVAGICLVPGGVGTGVAIAVLAMVAAIKYPVHTLSTSRRIWQEWWRVVTEGWQDIRASVWRGILRIGRFVFGFGPIILLLLAIPLAVFYGIYCLGYNHGLSATSAGPGQPKLLAPTAIAALASKTAVPANAGQYNVTTTVTAGPSNTPDVSEEIARDVANSRWWSTLCGGSMCALFVALVVAVFMVLGAMSER